MFNSKSSMKDMQYTRLIPQTTCTIIDQLKRGNDANRNNCADVYDTAYLKRHL